MAQTLTVKCPDCNLVLIVDAKTGEVIEKRKPLVAESSGDTFEDARKRVLGGSARVEKLFEEARRKESGKAERLEKLFEAKKQELKDQPIERPDRPMDRD